jgi:mono/diheme cytochrome c family protein
MKSQFITHAGTAVILGLGILNSYAQDAAPTSVELAKTLIPIFKEGKIEQTIEASAEYRNFRFMAEYDAKQAAYLILRKGYEVELPAGNKRKIEVAYEHSSGKTARYRVWVDGLVVEKGRDIPNSEVGDDSMVADLDTSTELMRLDRNFTMMVEFTPDQKGGALFAKTIPSGKGAKDSKALLVRNGKLVYNLGGLASLEGKTDLKAGQKYVAVVVSKTHELQLYLDGKLEKNIEKFTNAPDPQGSVFQIGKSVTDLAEDFGGRISGVRFWGRDLNEAEITSLSKGNAQAVNTPDLNWTPDAKIAESKDGEIPGHPIRLTLEILGEFEMHRAVVQPLALSDHQTLVKAWDKKSIARGKIIYSQLCVTCHGTLDQPGSLPTAPRFHLGEFKNGADPYRMFQTLEKGYGQMIGMPQYNTAQKYDVIHYIREEYLKGKNEKQLTAIDDDYLASLPRGMTQLQEQAPEEKDPQYLLQDYGNVLFWTLQVEPGNIAQKGITVRLDEGAGGVSKGNSWMLYEHDTMRVAAIWTGDKFIDWKGIGFDGSHGTHTSIVGDKHFISKNEPAWANPETGNFKDLRILGRDGLPYGPLPRTWMHFSGVEIHGENPVLRYTVGDCVIREIPKLISDNVFERWIYCGPSSKELKLRLDESSVHTIPASDKPLQFGLRYQNGKVEVFTDLKHAAPSTPPASTRFDQILTTKIQAGEAQGAWAVDTFETPASENNPWKSWMRTSGFDFFEGGKSAAVCTWDGDVWIVDGIDQSQGELKWQRICSGLFQPLGLKILNGQIYVGCRDMIAILRDVDGDRETDYIENFNSDHQVTEHFHEFAMGLQADAEGNFYYAKSARHAKTPVVPHHGTLLKVSKDGMKTEILATGFRAANGICLNPDGSFMVTDQEGHWTPKNRINWVRPDGEKAFYGNMWGYHSITDESDSAMRQPLCWITNSYDRSPAELLWVPENSAWKSLRGSLLNLSYGEGKIYTVPFEKIGDEVQGGMSALPFKPLPTGIMRGHFSPLDGQLYGCGMFAWAGNRQQPGGFYRIRYTELPACQPVALNTSPGKVTIGFSDAIDATSAAELSSWQIRAWDIKRTGNYGSKHQNERTWNVSKAELSADRKTATLHVPELAPTWGMSIQMKLRNASGEAINREIHNSIFTLD